MGIDYFRALFANLPALSLNGMKASSGILTRARPKVNNENKCVPFLFVISGKDLMYIPTTQLRKTR